jgi:hypothetical protein
MWLLPTPVLASSASSLVFGRGDGVSIPSVSGIGVSFVVIADVVSVIGVVVTA